MSTQTTSNLTSYSMSLEWQGSNEVGSILTATLRADAGFTEASAKQFAQAVFQAAIAATGTGMTLYAPQFAGDAITDTQTSYTVNTTTGAIT